MTAPHPRVAHRPRRSRRRSEARARPLIDQLRPDRYDFEIPHPATGSYPRVIDLSVIGRKLKPGSTLRFNGKSVKAAFISSTRLDAKIPFSWVRAVALRGTAGGPDGFQGTARIRVRTPGPHGRTSPAKPFPIKATPID